MVHVTNYNIFAHDKSIYYVSVYLQIGWDSKILVVFFEIAETHFSSTIDSFRNSNRDWNIGLINHVDFGNSNQDSSNKNDKFCRKLLISASTMDFVQLQQTVFLSDLLSGKVGTAGTR